jgi:DHA3 family macrolide efflux protein-like MFS transporter
MLQKKDFARASALLSVAQSGSNILAPVIAALLIISIGLPGIILLDTASFVIAILTLAVVVIPQPFKTELSEKAKGSLFQEALYGFRYIFGIPSLLGLQLTFFFGNLLSSFGGILFTPMVLARTANSAGVLATVQTVAGIGGVLGGVLLSIWGGPKRRIVGVISGWFLCFVGMLALGLAQGVIAWAVAIFFMDFFSPLINSSNQAIWQAKIPPEIQGKVFSARSLIAQVAGPFSMLIAGPLADWVFEPAMRTGGALTGALGPLFGVGSGSGMSLMIALMGLLGMVVAFTCYQVPVIRKVESIVPDFVQPTEPGPVETLPETVSSSEAAAAIVTLRE